MKALRKLGTLRNLLISLGAGAAILGCDGGTSGVTPVNDPPEFVSTVPNQNWDEDTDLTDVIDLKDYFSDPEGASLTYGVSGNSNIDVDIVDGVVSLSQPADWNGSENVVFSASDGTNTTESNSVGLSVANVNDAPVLGTIEDIVKNEGELVKIIPSVTDADGDVVAITYTSPLNVSGEWTPNYDSSGTYVTTVTANDGRGGTDSQTVGITVNDVNRAPEFTGVIPNQSLTEDTGLTNVIDLKTYFSDPDGDTLTFSVSGDTNNLLNVDANTGIVNFVAPLNWNGSENVVFSASDGVSVNSNTVGLSVANVNDAPVIDALDDLVVEAGNVVSVSPSGSDVDGDSLTFTYSPPLDANGNFTPSADQIGLYGCDVTVTDGNGGSDTATFDLLAHSAAEDPVGKYVIVTSQSLAPNFEALRVWKENKGYDSEIVTIEDIVASESGRDTQEKIRERIKNIKLANMSKDVYVLLGGDVDIHTDIGGNPDFYRQVTATCSFDPPGPETELTDATMPADLYFSDLFENGTTTASIWDGNSDNTFARSPEDNPDFHPDVFVGRAPINTPAEADNFVRKVLNYEQIHDMSNVGNITFIAGMVDSDTDAKVAKSWINPNVYDFNANGFTVTGLYESDGTGNVGTVMSNLESGPHLVNVDTHGYERGINLSDGTLNSDGSYPAGDTRTLTNSKSTSRDFIFYSLGCNSNHIDNTTDFPSGDCILEELINNVNGGAVAGIGTGRIGLVFDNINAPSPNEGSGISWYYDRRFNESLFTKSIDNLGKAFADSKDYYAENSKESSGNPYWKDYRWIQLCLNLLGDPEMMVWKGDLGTITATTTQGANYTEVNTNTPGARVCLNDGTNVYSAITNNFGDAVFNVDGPVTTTVTKKDHLPYVE